MVSLFVALMIAAAVLAVRGFVSGSTIIVESYDFDAGPQTIWCYLSEPMARVLWEPGLTDVVSLEAPDVEKPSRWLLIMRSAGVSYDVEEDLLELKPNQSRRVRRLSDRYHSELSLSLSPAQNQVRLAYSERIQFVTPADRILAPFIGLSWSAKIEDGFRRLAEIVDRGSGASSPC